MSSIEWAGYLPYQLSNQWRVLFDLATEFAPESDRTKYLSGYCSLVPSNLWSKTSISQYDQLCSLHNRLL